MSINIRTYMANLIAGRAIIGGLYDAVNNARRVCSLGGNFKYTFSLNGFGTKRYNSCQLIKFDTQALCESLSQIFNNVDNLSNLDLMVVILLKGRTEIRNLYCSFFKAENARANAKILCYTFCNPYPGFVDLDKNCLRLSANGVITLFNQSQNIRFNPIILFPIH